MTIPMWVLLGFAAWTVLLLIATVGVYRWVEILFWRARIASFRSDQVEGDDWYRRGTRAHANWVENLPVFGAIVLVISAIGITGAAVNYLCAIVLFARVCQSLVHVSHVQTDAFVAVRFSFFCAQLVCFLALIVIARVSWRIDPLGPVRGSRPLDCPGAAVAGPDMTPLPVPLLHSGRFKTLLGLL